MEDAVVRNAGLSDEEASRRLKAEGPNELPPADRRGALRLLREVLAEPMFLLLVSCGGVYLALGDRQEAMMLLGFVFVVMAITFFQERRAERSLEALRDMSSPLAQVLRDGQSKRVPGRELVRGDIVLLAEGDRVPADILLRASSNLMTDESMLTGESAPVHKYACPGPSPLSSPSPPTQDAQVFSGTLVTQGSGRGEVIATGQHSTMGKIGKSLAALGGERTPIQAETRSVVKLVALCGFVLAGLLALAYGVLRGDWLHALLAGLTLAMAVIPEELPVVLTLFLGLGAWRLSRQKVLARSVPAVEMLGATTVLCVDKTGTLTTNQMVLSRLWCAGQEADIPRTQPHAFPEDFHALLEYAVLASHRHAFDPMENAIARAGATLLADTEHLHRDWTLVDDYPLTREMLAMSRVWQSPDLEERVIAAKGAPEAIIDLCHLSTEQSATIHAQVASMAARGLRVLGVAKASFPARALPQSQHDFDFEFLGLVALEDPLREDVPAAIAQCRAAGIRVVMITGDHSETAQAIARQAGLTVDGNIMSGAQLESLSDEALQERLPATDVFSRVKPEHKLRLVQAFRAMGEVVAMTGDGVNDAPALKAAHIGVAMGARGTDVAREAADLVLLNDDFASLVTAVRYGRRIFANLRKAIVFLVAVHVPIIGLSIVPVLFGWPLVLMPAHILFLQLIIDPSCATVFEAEALEPGAMAIGPRRSDARLFERSVLMRGLWQGLGLLLLLVLVHVWTRHLSASEDVARAMSFTVLVTSNLALILVNRAWDRPCWRARQGVNLYFAAMSTGTLLLLCVVLFVPEAARLFSFERPPLPMLLAALPATFISLLWFEAVKHWMHTERTERTERT